MKFLHLGDLHIGKKVNDFSMFAEQKEVLEIICNIADENGVDAVLISGDVYDVAAPSASAVSLFDDFLVNLGSVVKNIFIINGNHDSSVRLSYANRLLSKNGINIVGVYNPQKPYYTLKDDYGDVKIYMLPFERNNEIKHTLASVGVEVTDDENLESLIRKYIKNMDVKKDERNVLMAHLFVTDGAKYPEVTDSEILPSNVGTIDNVDVSVFADFNYVALGHLHRPQCIGRKEVRYSGSPLCYSRSEAPCYVVDAQNNFALKKISSDNIEKSVPLVNLDKDGTVSVKLIPLVTSKRMRVIKGSLNNILTAARYESEERRNDYVAADLTDESSVEFSNPIAKLREAYPFSMKPHMINAFKYDADRFTKAVDEENLSAGIAELFKCYFADNNDGEELTDEEFDFVKKIEASLEEVED